MIPADALAHDRRVLTLPKAPRRDASEQEWQRFVTDALDLAGWKWWHCTDSRKSPSGFPDLVAAHPTRGILFAELKAAAGRVRPEQGRWIHVLNLAAEAIGGGAGADVTVRVWKPADWRDVLEVTGVSAMLEGAA